MSSSPRRCIFQSSRIPVLVLVVLSLVSLATSIPSPCCSLPETGQNEDQNEEPENRFFAVQTVNPDEAGDFHVEDYRPICHEILTKFSAERDRCRANDILNEEPKGVLIVSSDSLSATNLALNIASLVTYYSQESDKESCIPFYCFRNEEPIVMEEDGGINVDHRFDGHYLDDPEFCAEFCAIIFGSRRGWGLDKLEWMLHKIENRQEWTELYQTVIAVEWKGRIHDFQANQKEIGGMEAIDPLWVIFVTEGESLQSIQNQYSENVDLSGHQPVTPFNDGAPQLMEMSWLGEVDIVEADAMRSR